MTATSHDHYSHMTQVGGGLAGGMLWHLCLFKAGLFLWIIMASFIYILKSLSSFTKYISQGELVACGGVSAVMVELGCLPSVCSLNLNPTCSILAVSPMYSFSHTDTSHCFSFPLAVISFLTCFTSSLSDGSDKSK